MSLRNLLNVTAFTITRVASTPTAGMGNSRSYTTGNRNTLPTTITGRMNALSAERRAAYAEKDIQITHMFYSQTNPQVDERDRFELNGRFYWVHGQRNPDELSIYFQVDCVDFDRNIQ